MGLFGPTSEELRLQAELADTQARLESTSTELARTHESEVRLLDVADSNRNTISGLQQEVTNNAIANRVATYVLGVLEKMKADGELDFGAEATAREVVKERTVAQVTASLTNELIDTEYARLVAEIDPATIDTVRRQLTETFTHDGTFEKLKDDAAQDTREKVIEELLTQAREAAAATNNTPEVRATLHAEIEADPSFMQQIADIQAAARKKALHEQRKEFEATAPEIAAQEVAAGRDVALAEFMSTWRNTYDGSDKITRLKRRLEKEVAEQGEDAILAETKDATLIELRTKREAQIARDLEAKILLNEFTDGGIDTTAIPVGARIELILGDVTEKEGTYYDKARSGTIRGQIKTIIEKRRLNLTAQDGGKFIVNFDSLADSSSVYEQEAAVPVGTVLRLGRQQIELGAVTLDDRIVYGVPIFYDTDDTDTTITSMRLKVRAIKLNHTLAAKPSVKKIAHVDGTTEDIAE